MINQTFVSLITFSNVFCEFSIEIRSIGWLNLNGTIPGKEYLEETTANVCFSTNLDECGQSVSIQIKNCGDFNLYYLKDTSDVSPYCQFRYCTE